MSEITSNNNNNNKSSSYEATMTTTSHASRPPPLSRSASVPHTPTSPLANNPWYRQKFEMYRDVIEEAVRGEFPQLPQTHKLQPANIEPSTLKGYDLDFPVELPDGQSTVVSVSYSDKGRPPYTKDERRKLISVRRNTVDHS